MLQLSPWIGFQLPRDHKKFLLLDVLMVASSLLPRQVESRRTLLRLTPLPLSQSSGVMRVPLSQQLEKMVKLKFGQEAVL